MLIRVTGRRNADEDPALSSLVANARRYVQQYRAAADGQVWVAFDGPAIERWLTQNGQPLWGHERPTTLVLLGGANRGSERSVMTTDDNSELKMAIDAAAAARGLPLVWPSAAELQKFHIDLLDRERRVARPPWRKWAGAWGGDGVLIGRASGASANANVRWTHLFQDRSSEYLRHFGRRESRRGLYAGMFAASGESGAGGHRSQRARRFARLRESGERISNRSPLSSRM